MADTRLRDFIGSASAYFSTAPIPCSTETAQKRYLRPTLSVLGSRARLMRQLTASQSMSSMLAAPSTTSSYPAMKASYQ